MGNSFKKEVEPSSKRRIRKKFKTHKGMACILSSKSSSQHSVTPSISNSKMQLTETEEGDPFQMVPLEIISHMFTFLHVKDLNSVALVCKKFFAAFKDVLLWKSLCERDLHLTAKWEAITWKECYQMVAYITWDPDNSVPCEFKFTDQQKTITKTTSYGVATARSKSLFTPEGKRYVFDVKVNYRRPNFFYGIGFIDKDINFNFSKACYPKIETASDAYERRFELQWFYWSDGNCWDILGSHPVNSRSRTYIAKRGVERREPGPPSLAFFSGDVIGIVLDYSSKDRPLLTFLLNGVLVHQFALPKPLEMYFAIYFYNANDSVTIMHCPQNKYDSQLKAILQD